MKLTIGYVYPDLLNLYGDRGNVQCLQKRLEWRGIESELIPFLAGDRISLAGLDIVTLGGGSDREQALAAEKLCPFRKEFLDYVEDNGVLLAVCGGYQLLGEYYKTRVNTIKGLNLLHFYTEYRPGRLVQDVVLDSPLFSSPIVGFANHGGRTYIGEYSPLGKVLYGFGNTEDSGQEGLVYKNVLASYLHGPLLPKNPQVCDLLISRAILRKYGIIPRLQPLSDGAEYRANHYIVESLAFCP